MLKSLSPATPGRTAMPGTGAAHPWRPLLIGTALIGSADLLFAWSFWASKGVSFVDILHSIARGWYGKASDGMGMTSALVGAASHYTIIFGMLLAYSLAARLHAGFTRYVIVLGAAYGLLLYLIMNFVLLPLSAAGLPKFNNLAWVASSIAMHMLIGVMIAWFVKKALAR
ncbi:MAG TPA: hypothetical protein VFF96_10565 [Pseudoxanthomonas sp.]|nr:hypothetical protein [Pseudoxanthomonas sp.]